MTFEEWWEQHYADLPPTGYADYTFGEEVWNAAQEAVLRPLLAAGDEDENARPLDTPAGNVIVDGPPPH